MKMKAEFRFTKITTPNARTLAIEVQSRVNSRWPGTAVISREKTDAPNEEWVVTITDRVVNDSHAFHAWITKNLGEVTWQPEDE